MKQFPKVFIERFESIIPSFRRVDREAVFKPRNSFFVRRNRLDVDSIQLEKLMNGFGGVMQMSILNEPIYRLPLTSLRDLQATDLYQTGRIYVQGLSSLLVSCVLDPQPGEQVLDIAAAPGSKATQIAMAMRGSGFLVANEKVRKRFYKLKANIELQGFQNIRLTLKDGGWFGRLERETYDRVLLDAPCSSEGRFRVDNPKSYRYWSVRKIKEMSHKQKRLIQSAFLTLKPGGILVYATCTYAPEENEAVVSWLLKKFQNEVEVCDFTLPVSNVMSGLREWQGRTFRPELSKTKRILPNREMNAFYIAKLKKRLSLMA